MMSPDFIILGAPKSGTTAMHQWLAEHPELALLPKELHFFGSDLMYQNPRVSASDYQKMISELPADAQKGEVAVWYMMSETAAKEIYRANSHTKIIFMLRSPIEAVPSLHQQMVYTGNEPEAELELALAQTPLRKQFKHVPDHYYCPLQGLFYKDVYRYKAQISRFTRLFPAEQCHVILFDDLKSDPGKVYGNLLAFLGVDTSYRPSFDVVNAAQVTRNKQLQKTILTPKSGLKKVVKTILPSKKVRENVKSVLWSLNSKEQKRAPISDQMRQLLEKEFEAEMELLYALKQGRKISDF